ncbi:hypothetical protein IAT38_003701 [Cryptococcus sp. DSM 104549]
MLSALSATLALLGGAFAADANAFWIVGHGNAGITSRVDPIVNPGAVSGHVHSVVGSSAFSPTYSYAHSIAGQCTTANIGVDHSNYWIPPLYRKVSGGFELVKMNRVNTYYLMRRGSVDEEVSEFREGFRMLAGSATRNTFDKDDYTNAAISYVCLGADGAPETNAFPERNCPQDLRAQVFFPNCWDGVNTWLEGSKHVAYPVSGGHDQGGPCPATHPKRIMSLFYEFHFTDDYDYVPGARVWASGDDLGYSLHGDFTNGWPAGYFKEIFSYGSTCNVQFALKDCPPLNQYLVQNGSSCVPDADALIVDEDVGLQGNVLATLPGNNPVWGLSGPKVPDANYVERGNLVSAASVPVTSGWTKMGCLAEPTSGRALNAATQTADDMSPEKCIAFCSGKGYSIAGIEYSTECYCGADGTSLAALGSDKCSMDCNGIDYSKGYCGGPGALTIYQEGGEAPAGSVTSAASSAAASATGSATGSGSATGGATAVETATSAAATATGTADDAASSSGSADSDSEATSSVGGTASGSTTATISSGSNTVQPVPTNVAAVIVGSSSSTGAAEATSAAGSDGEGSTASAGAEATSTGTDAEDAVTPTATTSGSSSGHKTCARSRKRRTAQW